jgi:DNA-binding CsgD family transcriptional regulator
MGHWDELSIALVEFAAELGHAETETELQHRYVDGIDRFMPGLGAGIYLLTEDAGEMRDVSAFGVSDYFIARYERLGRARDPVFHALVANRTVAYNCHLMSMEDWKASAFYREVLALHRVDHSVESPVIVDGRIAGTLNFGRHEEQGGYDALELTLVGTMGRVVGMALQSVREREAAGRASERLRAGLDLVAQPVVITDLASAERVSNPAARHVLEALGAANASLDELTAQPGRAEGDVVAHELPIALDDGTHATVRSRTVSPADGIQVSFLDLFRSGAEPPPNAINEPLTPREREVARLAARGLGDKEIAQQLFLSPHTVKGYMKACYRKLGVNNRVALARLPHV